MEIIPVIDLKGGLVVRARQGDRANYRPIQTPLSPTSEPADVVSGLLSLHPFKNLYAADLDAIEGRGDHLAQLARLASDRPDLALWVDNGCATLAAAEAFLAALPQASLVLGSESQHDGKLLEALGKHPRVILSLDFRGDRFIGPEALLRDAGPLARSHHHHDAGAGRQRRRSRSRALCDLQGACRLATGLSGRRIAEVATTSPQLEASGAAGILVASALHDGRLTSADLATFGGRRDPPDAE